MLVVVSNMFSNSNPRNDEKNMDDRPASFCRASMSCVTSITPGPSVNNEDVREKRKKTVLSTENQ